MTPPDLVYNNIISRSASLFTRYGYKVITLDDISIECGISKKTIYTFFDNKIDLVKKVVNYELEQFKQQMDEIRANARNAIEEQMQLIGVITRLSFRTAPTLRRDLCKFYQEAFQLIEEFKEQYLIPFFKTNLDQGVSEGLYLEGFDHQIMAYIRLVQLEAIIYKTLSMPSGIAIETIARQVNCHYISGLSTPKGFRILKKYTQSKQNKK